MNSGPLSDRMSIGTGVDARALLKHRHHILGLAAPAHPDGQAEAAVRVDHVQEVASAASSAVASTWKSLAHSCWGCSAWWHRTEPAVGHAPTPADVVSNDLAATLWSQTFPSALKTIIPTFEPEEHQLLDDGEAGSLGSVASPLLPTQLRASAHATGQSPSRISPVA